MMTRKVFFLITLAFLLLLNVVVTKKCQAKNKILSYKQAFENGEPILFEPLPEIEGWLNDDDYLRWEGEDKIKKARLLKINAKTGEESEFIDFAIVHKKYEHTTNGNPWHALTPDYKKFIFESDDDLFLFIPTEKLVKQLTFDKESEKNPQFSPDGKKIAFTKSNNLWILDLATGIEKQVTEDGLDLVYNGWASWVYYEEILGRSSKYKAFWWAPNSQLIAFMRFDDTKVPAYPIFHCEGRHGFLEMQRYPKAGDVNPEVRLGIYHLNEDRIVWIPAKDDSDHYLAWPVWAANSKSLFFQWLNREQDEIYIYNADVGNGSFTEVYRENQKTWVEFFEDLYLFTKQPAILIRSDVSGWRHLFLYDLEGNLLRQITDGAWNVEEICAVDEKNRWIYILASKDASTNRSLYRVRLNGQDLSKLSKEEGVHKVNVSPAGTYFIDTYSNIHQPSKIDLFINDGTRVRPLGNKNSIRLNGYQLGRTEIFTIRTDDDIDLPAQWILPPEFDKSKKYPVIFKVYGGPGRSSVQNQYPSLADYFYVQHGVIIIAVDHRGSSHFGKKGAANMHRVLGKWETEDLISAVKWLHKQSFIDKDRIGIVGGSYGGYVACMALTYGADYFTHGIARYSVTDWRFYDSIYTERYMDKPEENPAGYNFGSVMTHTEKYKGKLLITHGVLDDNVHIQSTITLIEDLQRFGKHFEIMIYPNQRHGIRGTWRTHATRLEIDFWFRHYFNETFKFSE